MPSLHAMLIRQPRVQSTHPVLIIQPHVQSTHPVLIVQPRVQSTHPVLIIQPSVQSTHPMLIRQPRVQSTHPASQEHDKPCTMSLTSSHSRQYCVIGEPLSAGAFQRSVRLVFPRLATLGGGGADGWRAGTAREHPMGKEVHSDITCI